MAVSWVFTDNSTYITVQRTINGIVDTFDCNKQLIKLFPAVEPEAFFLYSRPDDLRPHEFVVNWNDVSSPVVVSATDLTTQLQAMIDAMGGGGVSAFTSLTDVPNSYVGAAGQALRVNVGETGLEFFVAAGTGTVTSVSVVSANGFAGSVATATTTPAITISTTITGILKGNGTAISAATDADISGKLLTGYVSGAGVLAATDSILQGIQKLNGNIGALVTGVSSVNSLTGAVPLTGTANRITVSAANVFDISAAYIGQASITTLGTITTGVWNGTAIANANLANSTVTIGSTSVALGATVTTFAGLVSVTSTTFVGALTGNASTATNVAVGGITGLGTGVATALAINVGSAGAFVTFNGAGGTPSSITLTNATIPAKSVWVANSANTVTTVTPGASQSIRINAANTAWEAYTPVSSSGFATVALDNLAAVAINTTLLPASDDVIDLGSDTKRFHYLPLKLASGFIGWGTGGGDGSIDTSGTTGNSSLRFMNAAAGYIFDAVIKPSSATVDLGVTSAAPFRNLFLVATGKVDWGNGDVTLTGGTNTLTFAGASSGYTFDADTTIGTGNAFTCGTIELGAASDTTIARVSAGLISVEGKTVLTNTTTSGVGTSPTASQTDTITHNLLRTPTIIRIYGMSAFVANAAALPPVHSIGTFNSTGNRCLFQPYDAATITAAEPAATSTAFAIRLDTGVGNFITGVIQNVTSTQFDIVWTETGTATAQPYLWEAQ